MKRGICLSLWVLATLVGCGGQPVKPQVAASQSAAAPVAAPAVKKAPVVQNNLGRIADSNAVSREVLEGFTLGKTTRQEVQALLGEVKPFALGDGKTILRYDVGKFIFDSQGVLLRKFLAP